MGETRFPVSTAAAPRAFRYRPELDGLRALAILPILLLHSGFTQIRGGFVGVDVFFVLSGYLITGILRRDLAQGSFSVARFYRHRIVRILPALLFVLAVTAAVGCMILLPNPLRDLGHSIAATSVFGSNIYFFLTADYFAAASDTQPLIHTWSLAVEEQFYLFYPLLIWALRARSERCLAMVVGAVAALSFAAGAVLAYTYPSAGFFLLPARIWELAAGALVALGVYPALASPRLRTLACLGALAVIVLSCFLVRAHWPFPVPFAVPVVVATATLIAYGEGGIAARLLRWAPLRGIGLISYSAYLWHRPIIAFYQVASDTVLTLAESVLLTGSSLALAWLTWLLIERPVSRRWREGQGLQLHAAALAVLGMTAGLGLVVAGQAATIRPLPPDLHRIAGYLGWDRTAEGRAQFSTDRCFVIPSGGPFDPACLRLSQVRPNVLLMGDSHAAHYSLALREALPGATVLQATAAGCKPVIDGKGLRRCRDVMARAFSLDSGRIDTVILSALWLDSDVPPLLDTVRWLRARGSRVVVLGPSVEYDADLPTVLVRSVRERRPDLPTRLRRTDRFETDRRLAPLVRSAGGIYFSAIDSECPAGACRLVAPGGAPAHFDHSHMTPEMARLIVDAVVERHLRKAVEK